LTDEVARFQTEVRRLALDAVREILQQELDRKRAKLPVARPRAKPPAARPRTKPPAARSRAKPPAAGQPATPPEPPDISVVPADVTVAPEPATEQPQQPPQQPEPSQQPASPPAGSRKRVPWTRETIVHELANWMLSGTAIDATFVARHGPPGLVAATRRIFGRFEAALNVAALHVSKLYPDGPPER
jgi:hypothetical protein